MDCASFDSAAWQRSQYVLGGKEGGGRRGTGEAQPPDQRGGRHLLGRPLPLIQLLSRPEARTRFLNIQTLPHSPVIPKFSTLSSFSTTDSTSPALWDSPRTGLCVLAKKRAPAHFPVGKH